MFMANETVSGTHNLFLETTNATKSRVYYKVMSFSVRLIACKGPSDGHPCWAAEDQFLLWGIYSKRQLGWTRVACVGNNMSACPIGRPLYDNNQTIAG
jgi:hypothetical protein